MHNFENDFDSTPDILVHFQHKGQAKTVRVAGIGAPPVCDLDMQGLALLVSDQVGTNTPIVIDDYEMAASLNY